MTNIMTRGQALSTWIFSGSANDTDTTLFQDTTDAKALRPIRIQGFSWTGSAVLTVKDARRINLFTGSNTSGLWPPGISGSYGVTTNAPLYMTVATSPAGGGGTLIIYGEVL